MTSPYVCRIYCLAPRPGREEWLNENMMVAVNARTGSQAAKAAIGSLHAVVTDETNGRIPDDRTPLGFTAKVRVWDSTGEYVNTYTVSYGVEESEDPAMRARRPALPYCPPEGEEGMINLEKTSDDRS